MTEIYNGLTAFYKMIGLEQTANLGDVLALGLLLFLLLVSLFTFLGKKSEEKAPEVAAPKAEAVVEEAKEEAPAPKVEEAPKEPAKPKLSWSERLTKGLSKTREQFFGSLESVFSKKAIGDEELEEIEELLYSADLGPKIVGELTFELEDHFKGKEVELSDFKEFLHEAIQSRISKHQGEVDPALYNFNPETHGERTKVIMVVGVNGAGKTTTIGKLATKLRSQGADVVVGACDTFRAAAVDQLQVWCERAQVEMVRAKEGNNPSGVAYAALEKAINQKAHYCILDTAGRLHTKGNLMDELKKNKRVLSKLDESAPDHVLLVIDAVTGQNAMRQAEEFNAALGLTGLIFTKCDGSSKAGGAVGIIDKLQVPIAYIGVGEEVEDLDVFEVDSYLKALLGA